VAPVPEYYPMIRDICTRHNVLWIADEIMTGVGRTGTFLAIEHWKVLPDIVVLAKGLSSGYAPLSAILVHDRVFKVFKERNTPYVGGHTYNAHPVTAAAGLAVLNYLERNKIIEGVKKKGERLGVGLRELEKKLPIVGNVRGKGLMWGMELVKDKRTKEGFDPRQKVWLQVMRKALDNGLIVYPVNGCIDGERGDGLLICPPLVVSDEEIDFLLRTLEESLASVAATAGVVS
jgi:adenosylmethionine-8-amino-7-oxononanoate aminotransferase